VKRRLEREFFESEEKMKVGVSSVRIDRVQIGSNKDRQMKKSMISTPALLTEDFSIFLPQFLFVFFFTESFIQFVPHTLVRMYNMGAFSKLTCGIEEAGPGATSGP